MPTQTHIDALKRMKQDSIAANAALLAVNRAAICTSKGQIRMRIEDGLWRHQLACLELLAPYTPKRRARKLRRKFQVALANSRIDGNGLHYAPRPARFAGDLAVEVRVPGFDELLAAALRAAKKRLVCFHGLGASNE